MDKQLETIEKQKAKRTANPVRLKKRLLTLAEGAEYLGRKPDSVRDLLYRRELRCIQKGNGKIWLDLYELDRWVENSLHFM
jgi:hypothetical protein